MLSAYFKNMTEITGACVFFVVKLVASGMLS